MLSRPLARAQAAAHGARVRQAQVRPVLQHHAGDAVEAGQDAMHLRDRLAVMDEVADLVRDVVWDQRVQTALAPAVAT